MRVTGLACFLLTALLLFGLVRHVAGPIGAAGGGRGLRHDAVLARLGARVDDRVPRDRRCGRVHVGDDHLAGEAASAARRARARGRARRNAGQADDSRPLDSPGALVSTRADLGATHEVAPSRLDGCPRLRPARGRVPLDAPCGRDQGGESPTAFLTSSRLQEWNFGTLDQRLDPDAWLVVLKRLPSVVGLLGIFLVVAAVATWRSPQRRFWIGMWLAAIGPFLVFTNLYFQHDYYLAAVSPAFAALIGLGVGFTLAPLAKRPLALVSRLARPARSRLRLAGARARVLAANPRRRRRSAGASARTRARIPHPNRRPGRVLGTGVVSRGAVLRRPLGSHARIRERCVLIRSRSRAGLHLLARR